MTGLSQMRKGLWGQTNPTKSDLSPGWEAVQSNNQVFHPWQHVITCEEVRKMVYKSAYKAVTIKKNTAVE